jgi:hypothetical protein
MKSKFSKSYFLMHPESYRNNEKYRD